GRGGKGGGGGRPPPRPARPARRRARAGCRGCRRSGRGASRKLKASLGGCPVKAGKGLALDRGKAFVMPVERQRGRERERHHPGAQKLLVAHRAVVGPEEVTPLAGQVTP